MYILTRYIGRSRYYADCTGNRMLRMLDLFATNDAVLFGMYYKTGFIMSLRIENRDFRSRIVPLSFCVGCWVAECS